MKKIKTVRKFFTVLSVMTMAFFCGFMSVSCSDGSDSSEESGTVAGGGNSPSGDETGSAIVLDASENVFSLEEGKTYSITLSDISLAASKTFNLSEASWKIDNPYIAAVHGNKIEPLSGGEAKLTSGNTVVNIKIAEPNREVTSDPFDLKTVSENIDIFCCGDSIMRDYGASDSDQYGLGQALKVFFDESKANVVTDISNGGRSSRLFYNEASRWPEVKRRIEKNNEEGKKSVVIFSFGHNDQRALTDVNKDYGAQFTFAKTNKNGTVAGTHFDFMEKYIVETRALGAVPVCVTPFARASFSGSEVSADGKHDWSNKIMTGDDTPRGNYPAAMKAAAQKQGAILIDMTELSAAKITEYNNAGKIKYFYVDSDNTHERTLGGLELAKIVTDELKKGGYLTSYIKETPKRVMVNKSSLAFGRLFANAKKDLSFKLSLFNESDGTVTVTAPEGYTVCATADGEYKSSLVINCADVQFGTEIFVRFSPSEVKEYNADLTVTHSSVTPDFGNTPAGTVEETTLKIAMTAAGKEKIEGGTPETVLFPMIDANKAFDYNGAGKELSGTVTLTGLEPSTARQEGTEKPLSGPYYARVGILGGNWPVNDSGTKRETEYIQYAIPASGADFVVNKISFKAASSGSGWMMWHAYYSKDENFANPTPIVENANSDGKAKEVMIECSTGAEELGLTVEEGQTLYVRIYPAFKTTTESKGRTFMISNLKVEGLIQ